MARPKVAYPGTKGSFTEDAFKSYMPLAEGLPCPTIEAVFATVADGGAQMGFVPIENVFTGRYAQTLDNLLAYSSKIKITGASIMPVEYALGAHLKHSVIKKIYSKSSTFEQCSIYLDANFKDAEKVVIDDLSEIIGKIASRNITDSAVIAMACDLSINSLKLVATNIGNIKDNKTRFILLGNRLAEPTGRDVTSLVIYPKRDRVKLLYDMLDIISLKHNLNMTDIERRPDKKGLSIFYLDIEGHISDENVKTCINEISAGLTDTEVIILGSYPYLPFNEPLIRKIGIIGGTGEMGKFFIPFFGGLGYEVIVAGRNTRISHEDCAKTADAVIINVPIEHTESVIRKIGPLMKKGQLLIDNTGVKSGPINIMLNETSPEVEVLSIHTMFGPGVEGIRGENIISVHTQKSGPMSQEFEDILYKHGAQITHTTPEQHDMNVTMTQGLEHIDSVAKLATILALAGHPDNLQPFSTPNSRLSAEIYERIHSQDPKLYSTMLKENPFIAETIKIYTDNLLKIYKALETGDLSVFEELMKQNAEKLK